MTKKIKMIGVSIIVLAVAIIVIIVTGSKSDISFVGKWYESDGDYVQICNDKTWKATDSIFVLTGKWEQTDKNRVELYSELVELIAFYGKDELGDFIEIDNEKYYKDAYPSREKLSEYKDKTAIAINPFEGISYEVIGVSPYCRVTINDDSCSNIVKQYVTFQTDKNRYAIGETAIIKATLSSNTGSETYKLSETETTYNVKSQSKYITSIEEIDTTFLKKEIEDKILSLKSEAQGSNILAGVYQNIFLDLSELDDNGILYDYHRINTVTPEFAGAYMSSLKQSKENEVNDMLPYNKYTEIYRFDVSAEVYRYTENGGRQLYDCTGCLYISITANNILINEGGDFLWGDNNMAFTVETSIDSYDNFVANTITSESEFYNINKIEN